MQRRNQSGFEEKNCIFYQVQLDGQNLLDTFPANKSKERFNSAKGEQKLMIGLPDNGKQRMRECRKQKQNYEWEYVSYLFMIFLILYHIIQIKMSDWYHPFQSLRDGMIDRMLESLEEDQENKLPELYPPNLKQSAPLAQTTLPPIPPQDIKSRSIKIKGKEYEISFEACFMEEHEKAFKKQTSNFIESCFKQINCENLSFKILQSLDWQSAPTRFLDQKQKKQFDKDLETQQKFTNFIEMFQENSPEEVSCQLSYLAYLAWENYLKIRVSLMSKNKLIENAQNFASKDYEKIFEQSGIKFLNLDVIQQSLLNSRQTIKNAFERFLRFFYVTIFLVVQEYFENPYNQEEEAKRQRNFGKDRDPNDDFYLEDQFSSSDDSNFYINLPYKKLHKN